VALAAISWIEHGRRLDELNKELAYWDAMVADTIIPVAQQGIPYNSGVLDLAQGLRVYRQRLLDTLANDAPGRASLTEHVAYADLLIAANLEAAELD
jgi:hypothetical protein